MSSNNFLTASFCRSTASAVRRAWSEPFCLSVTIFSASGRTAFALARVVFDPLMLDQTANLIRQQRFPVFRGAPQV